MGTDGFPKSYDLYICRIGQEDIKLSEIKCLDDLTVSVSAQSEEFYEATVSYIEQFGGITITIPVKTKWMRCRNRKRYIKLLMSIGMSRRQAGWSASFTQTAIQLGYMKSYQDSWNRQIFNTIYPKECRKEDQNG